MNEFDRLLNEAFPAAPVSDALRTRVSELPRPKVGTKPVALRSLWLASAGMAGLALGVALLLPRNASAQALIAKASQGFVGHTRTFSIDARGKRQLIAEGWFTKDRERVENPSPKIRSVLIVNAEKGFAFYWARETGTFQIWKRDFGATGPDVPSTLEPKALAETLRRWKGGPVPTLLDAVLDGKKVKKVALKRGKADLVLYGEPGTLRLIAYEAVGTLYGREWGHQIIYLEPGDPPAERFEPVVELNGRRFNVLQERGRIEEGLKKPIAEYPVPGGTVAIRGVTMNRNRDLFLLYTGLNAGYGKDYLPGTVTDDAGGVYVRGIGFAPTEPNRRGRLSGFTFDGKPLEGAWYTRIGGKTPSKVAIAFRRQSEPGWPIAFRHVQRVSPAPWSVPDFMPFMSMGMSSPASLEEGRAFALTEYYDRTKNWKEMERWARRNIALTDPRLEAAGLRGSELLHYQLAKALAMQGRRAEARREIAEARARALGDTGSSVPQQLKELEARLGS